MLVSAAGLSTFVVHPGLVVPWLNHVEDSKFIDIININHSDSKIVLD